MKRELTMPTPQEMQNFISIANVLGTCPYYAKMGAGGVLAIWLAARELGLPPMLCLNKGMYVIEGSVTMSAQLMNMMVVNAGHRADIVYLNNEGCKIRFVRSDREKGQGDIFEYEFKMDDAQRAGYFGTIAPNGQVLKKPKDNWMNSPRDMFYARCLSGGARKFMPDVLMNTYAIGEMPGDDDIKIDPLETQISVKAEEMSALQVNNQQPTQNAPLSPEKAVGYDEFIAKHEISDGSRKMNYLLNVQEVMNKMGKSAHFISIVNGAMKDEPRFLAAYHDWELKQTGTK